MTIASSASWLKMTGRSFGKTTVSSGPMTRVRRLEGGGEYLRRHDHKDSTAGTAELDTNSYQAGRHIPDDELETIYLRKDPFDGEGNYALVPRQCLRELGLTIS